MSKRKVSEVWKCFNRLEPKVVQCKDEKCKEKFAYHNSTTVLWSHLRVRHFDKHEELMAEKDAVVAKSKRNDDEGSAHASGSATKQLSMEEAIGKKKLYDTNHPQRKKLDRLVLDMITKDIQPFKVVEGRGFKTLVANLDPRYTLPSRTKLSSSLLPEAYTREMKRVMHELEQVDSIAITTDHWTSLAMRGYLTVTAHCIDSNWDIQSYVLETPRVARSCTGVNICEDVKEVLDKFKIFNKICAVNADNAPNMDVAIRELQMQRVHCFAHTLNLTVQTALEKTLLIKTVQDKVKAMVKFFHQSTKATDILNTEQTKSGKKSLEVDPRVPNAMELDV